MTHFKIEREPSKLQKSVAEVIEAELLSAISTDQPQTVNESLVFCARTETDRIIGGVTGATSYGWLLVKTLWVDADYSGRRARHKSYVRNRKHGDQVGLS